MNIQNIKSIFKKEFFEYKIRTVVGIVGYFIISLLLIIPSISKHNIKLSKELLEKYNRMYSFLDANQITTIAIIDKKLLTFLLMIIVISSLFWILESIIKEKENRTIENLFSLPISDSEIFIGKLLLNIITSLLSIYLTYLFLIIYFYNVYEIKIFHHIISLNWLLVMFVFIPSLSLNVSLIGLILSSKLNKYQTAQMTSLIFIIPVFFLYFYLSNSALYFSVYLILVATIFIIFLDVILFLISLQTFNREKIILNE